MNYYKRHIGDYNKKAARLSMLQHGAYTLLMDSCYDRERFPTKEEAIEWVWASSKEEVEAVEFVLLKFFELQDDGTYVQSRVSEEVERYQENAARNKRIAIEREAKRRENSTDREPDVNEPPPNHKPLTNNHKPITSSKRGSRLPADWKLSKEFYEAAKTIKPEWPDGHIKMVSDSFRDYWVAQAGQKGVKLDWLATWRNWCRNDRTPLNGQMNHRGGGQPPNTGMRNIKPFGAE